MDSLAALDRPRIVVLAVRLLWGSLLLGVPVTIYDMFQPEPGVPMWLNIVATLFGWLIGFGISYWLYTAAWRGRGWSRIVQAVLLALGVLAIPVIMKIAPQIIRMLQLHVVIIYLVQNLIGIAAVGMLFSPSANAWYRAMRHH